MHINIYMYVYMYIYIYNTYNRRPHPIGCEDIGTYIDTLINKYVYINQYIYETQAS
jgi:hypothetical protein